MARIGFVISKVRRRFGTGFMIGLDGLNVPAPAQFLKIIQRRASQWDPAKLEICIWASHNLQQDNMQKQ
jgi:hypothetical protein